jgi:hypothetical protein
MAEISNVYLRNISQSRFIYINFLDTHMLFNLDELSKTCGCRREDKTLNPVTKSSSRNDVYNVNKGGIFP